MGRKHRLDVDGAWHHVMNRGSGRRVVFANDHERRLFLELLGEAGTRTGLETHAYCLMSNHFHLLVRSVDGSLSAAMQYVSSSYTRRTNTWRKVDGPIFRGRFHSVRVEEVAHLQQLCRYIHRNPVEAGLVSSARDYRWSSLRAFTGDQRPPAFLHTSAVLGWFGGNPQRLLDHVDDVVAPSTANGLADPEAPAAQSADSAPAGPSIVLAQLERWIEIDFGCEAGAVRSVTSGSRNLARLGLVLLAVEHLHLSAPEVAGALQVAPGTVRSAVARARRRRTTDPVFAASVAAVENRLGRRAA